MHIDAYIGIVRLRICLNNNSAYKIMDIFSTDNKSKYLYLLLGIFILKITIILGGIPLLMSIFPDGWNTGHWPDGYDKIAMNIIQGHGYKIFPEASETMQRMPGYPLLLAALFYLFGKSIVIVQVLNVIFSSLAAYFVFRMTITITRSEKVSYLAAAITAFYPGVIIADGRGGLESLYMLFTVLIFVTLYKALQEKILVNYIYFGCALGFALLIKSTFMLLPVFLLLYMLYRNASVRGIVFSIKATSIVVMVMIFVLSPWIIRNYHITSKIVPTTSLAGVTLYQGLYLSRGLDGERDSKDVFKEASVEQMSIAETLDLSYIKTNYFFQQFSVPSDEIKFSNYLGRRSLDTYLSSPEILIKAAVGNSLGFWVLGKSKKSTLINILLVVPFLMLTIHGVFIALRGSYSIAPMVLVVLSLYAPHVLILGVARYHIPLIPLLAIFVSLSLVDIGERYMKHISRENVQENAGM